MYMARYTVSLLPVGLIVVFTSYKAPSFYKVVGHQLSFLTKSAAFMQDARGVHAANISHLRRVVAKHYAEVGLTRRSRHRY
jgi:hypothetical protein